MRAKKVYELTKKIPQGRVTSYGEIAEALGGKKYSRAVGRILNKNFSPEVPCHRVVRADGKVGGFNKGKEKKIKMLKKEGLEFKEDKIVSLEKVLFRFQQNF